VPRFLVIKWRTQMRRLKDVMMEILPPPTVERIKMLARRFERVSFSQEGEDLLLLHIFENHPSGFYVDVGAFHPVKFSNTYLLYKRGWRGINIDATPGSMDLFRRWRKRDINIEAAVGDKKGVLTCYMFNQANLNTFDSEVAKKRAIAPGCRLLRTVHLEIRPLGQILAEYLPAETKIDLLNVDAEQSDLSVLLSNDWERYRPNVVVVELTVLTIEGVLNSELYKFMSKLEYRLFARTISSCFFLDVQFLKSLTSQCCRYSLGGYEE
jgi:FkbM family methyltransferase